MLARYATKTGFRYYAGQITAVHEGGTFEVKFLTKLASKGNPHFIFPEKEDCDEVEFEHIVTKLPHPVPVGGTARAKQQLTFEYDLTSYTI